LAETISAARLHEALTRLCDTIEGEKDYLSELDGAIGDGDHGVNMAECFRGVKVKLTVTPAVDVGAVLNAVGFEVMNSVGGAMGALYGTLFIRLAMASAGKREVNLAELTGMFESALEGVIAIGQAKPGDKTLLDTLKPAVDALSEGCRDGKSLSEALARFEKAARAGMESTTNMVAKVGRASRLGERTRGHQDAGATSCFLVLQAFTQAV
jgi:dihydroxyacetone kinase-like protein